MLCVPFVIHLSLDTDFCNVLQEVIPLLCRWSLHTDKYMKETTF